MNTSDITNFGLLFLRVAFSGMMLVHGIPKLLNLVSGNLEFRDPFGMGAPMTLFLAVVGEVVFPIMIIIGFKTRLATIPVIITMALAAFWIHTNDPFSTKEKALVFLFVFMAIALLGAGKYSIDKK